MKCSTERPGSSWLQGLQCRVHPGLLLRPAGPEGRSSLGSLNTALQPLGCGALEPNGPIMLIMPRSLSSTLPLSQPNPGRPAGGSRVSRGLPHTAEMKREDCLVQAGMRWGKGGWDLGSSAGHGFGGGLFSFATLGGLQARCSRWKVRAAHGALPGSCVLGDPAPLTPLGPAREGGTAEDRAGYGGEVGKGGRLAS